MAQQVNLWQCSKCHSFHNTENLAVACEEGHKNGTKVEYLFHKQSIGWRSTPLPDKVKVHFSDKWGDYAIYKFERYGTQGI